MTYTYIKNSVNGFYVTFDQKLNAELFNNLGSTYQDFLDGKWVLLSKEQVKFHETYPQCGIEDVLNMKVPVAPQEHEETLDEVKNKVISDITVFDNGLGVNQFFVMVPLSEDEIARNKEEAAKRKEELGLEEEPDVETTKAISAWFTPAERSDYKNSIDAAQLLNIDTLNLVINDIPLTVSTEEAAKMLAAIQVYANACYLVTKQHQAAIQSMDSIEAVKNYDYRTGYPEKLRFNI